MKKRLAQWFYKERIRDTYPFEWVTIYILMFLIAVNYGEFIREFSNRYIQMIAPILLVLAILNLVLYLKWDKYKKASKKGNKKGFPQ